jgi:hypothetical protein
MNYGLETYHMQRKTVKEIKPHKALIILIKIFTCTPALPSGNGIRLCLYFILKLFLYYRGRTGSVDLFMINNENISR